MVKKMEATINQRFKMLRIHLGLNQKQMADELELVQATISAIEKEKQAITPQTIELLHRKFKANKFWLIEGKGEMIQNNEVQTEKQGSASWKEEAYIEVKSKNAFLEREVERLWQMIQHLTGGKAANFLNASEKATFMPWALFPGMNVSGAILR